MSDGSPMNERPKGRVAFSIRSINVLLFAASFVAAGAAFLFKAIQGHGESTKWFVPYVALVPLGLMVAVYWWHWAANRMTRRRSRQKSDFDGESE